jgi:hypothetical protein
LKQTINVGAYGWLHPHWINTFYPEDLPADWRLGYYSNEFNTVLVPSFYWQEHSLTDCAALLDDAHSGFQFFIECDDRIFDTVSLLELNGALSLLKPQLSGLVFPGGLQVDKAIDERFLELADSLEVDMIAGQSVPGAEKLWRPGDSGEKPQQRARFAIIEDDLRDLRAVRSSIEPFISQLQDQGKEDGGASLIVSHPKLQVADLSKFRSVLEIMGH